MLKKKPSLKKCKIKKDDIVHILSGKDKGKQGVVLKIIRDKTNQYKVMVEGIAIKKKHVKGNPQKQKTGGIIKKESFIDISNVAIFNKDTSKHDKIAYKKTDNKKKIRIFKSNLKEISSKG
jgi:large subunit ribosomal protein L24